MFDLPTFLSMLSHMVSYTYEDDTNFKHNPV